MDLSVISIAVSISVSLAAIISPGIVTWMNNRHQLKIKKMELLQEQFEEMIPKIKQLIRLQL